MKAIGFMMAFFGWLMAMNGYTVEHVIMIVIGISLFVGSYYIGKR